MPSYIIEHLDEELFEWSACGKRFIFNILEYKSLTDYVKPSGVIFTNASFKKPESWAKFGNQVQVQRKNIEELASEIPFNEICLLDSEAAECLSPEDSQNFKYFLFGGILGNTDEFDFDRTQILRSRGYASRNLGSVQMSTDTAVKVTKNIIENSIQFNDLKFIDRPEIKCYNTNESLILNFRFLDNGDGKPLIAEGIEKLMLKDEDFDLSRLE